MIFYLYMLGFYKAENEHNQSKNKKIADFIKKKEFRKFSKIEFLNIWSSINHLWGQARSHKQCGSDRFSRFDVYWIQTNTQHPSKVSIDNFTFALTLEKLWKKMKKVAHVYLNFNFVGHQNNRWNTKWRNLT